MESLVHTRDQGIVETVDFTRRMWSEEGEDCLIGWKGDGHHFLGFTRCDLHRLPGEGQNCHRALLCRIIGPIRRRIAEKTALFGEGKTCSYTMTTHRLKPPPLPWPNWSNFTTNCCPIDHILQIWPRATFIFPNLKKSLAGQKFESNEESSPPRRPTLQTSIKHIFQMG